MTRRSLTVLTVVAIAFGVVSIAEFVLYGLGPGDGVPYLIQGIVYAIIGICMGVVVRRLWREFRDRAAGSRPGDADG